MAVLFCGCDPTNDIGYEEITSSGEALQNEGKIDPGLLTAVITEELTDDAFIVCPVEGEWELNSTDKIFAYKEWADESIRPMLKVGTIVVIQYDGLLMETYPSQINADKLWIQSVEDSVVSD